MAKTCNKCSSAINGIDIVTCRGFCGLTFHMTCTAVTHALMSYFTTNKNNLFWMCDECAELFRNSHFRAMTMPSNESGPIGSLTNAITELRNEIQQLASKPAAPSTPLSRNKWPILGHRTTYKRQRVEETEARAPDACQVGCKQPAENVIGVPTCKDQPEQKFWLYLSRIQPDVTNEAVSAMVKANLETNDNPIVAKLVPKGRDVAMLSFVSFKIGIDKGLKTKALDPATWPEGILFREFENFGGQGVRLPTKYARFSTPIMETPQADTPIMNLT